MEDMMTRISSWDFCKLLTSFGTVAQYTMLGMLEQNDVVERRNRTPMDMVRFILSICLLLESL